MSGLGTHDGAFVHEALFYSDPDELLAGAVPFIREGVEAGEAVMIAMPGPNLDVLRVDLSDAAEEVRFLDMGEVGRNPGRLISAWWDFIASEDGRGRGVRGVGEPVWLGRSAAELDECERHEALLNVAFADAPFLALMCPYDTVNLSDAVLVAAEHSHPSVSGSRSRSAKYSGVTDVAHFFGGELERPLGSPDELTFDEAQLPALRRFVEERGRRAGLSQRQLEDLVLASNEVATNSLRHAGGEGALRMWADEDAVVCDFSDSGTFREPLVGRLRPDPAQLGGRGLWIANQLCDLVQIRSTAAGSLVRLQLYVDAENRAAA